MIASPSAFGQFPELRPPTPLFGAALSGDTAGVKHLLANGANPNEGQFLGMSPVLVPIMMQNREMFQAFADAGADLTIRDGKGNTTLMSAVYNEHPDEEIIRRILEAGVDPNATDASGDTALVLAMRRGSTAAVRILEEAGASLDVQLRESVKKSVALLQKSSPQFIRTSGCISCHHQSLPAMAVSVARQRGIPVNEEELANDVAATLAVFRSLKERMAKNPPEIPDPAVVVTHTLVGLAASKHSGDDVTEAMVQLLARIQNEDGSWRPLFRRLPLEGSDFAATALGLRAMQHYGNDEKRVAQAAAWLMSHEARSTEDRAMQLLGLAWARADREIVDRVARELLTKQLPGGGWSQVDTPEADAYATGQALVALYTSGVIKPSDAAAVKGVEYLLRTQLSDGSWHVVTRSYPVQPYKESGFPHGKDQWISAAGTSWAATALGLSTSHPDQAGSGGSR